MDEQRVPNFEEMDEQDAHRFLTELLSNLSPEEEYNVWHQDYVMEMPQSEERFRGREKTRDSTTPIPAAWIMPAVRSTPTRSRPASAIRCTSPCRILSASTAAVGLVPGSPYMST
jgi:hypothetical protein